MKRFISISVVFFLLFFCSCGHTVKKKLQSFIGSYIEYNSLSSKQVGKQCVQLCFGGTSSVSQLIKDDQDRFETISKLNGDIGYNTSVNGNTGAGGLSLCTVFSPNIVSIDVVTSRSFDAMHKENSSLGDIVRFMSFTLYPFISSGYTNIFSFKNSKSFSEPFSSYMAGYFTYFWPTSYPNFDYEKGVVPLHPVDGLLNSLRVQDLKMLVDIGRLKPQVDQIVGYLYFERLPDLPGDYDIRIEITDENGKVYTSDITMSFDF